MMQQTAKLFSLSTVEHGYKELLRAEQIVPYIRGSVFSLFECFLFYCLFQGYFLFCGEQRWARFDPGGGFSMKNFRAGGYPHPPAAEGSGDDGSLGGPAGD